MQTPDADFLLRNCLYFTVSRFARQMNKLAEEAFASIDIPPSYAYLILIIHDHPGMSQKELCKKLSIAPSTNTRLIDKLVQQHYVVRKQEGKQIALSLTEAGQALCLDIYDGLDRIYKRHAALLDTQHSQQLIHLLHEASEQMEQQLEKE